MPLKSPSASATVPFLPVAAGALAASIFIVDTLSPLGMAIAVLYVVVVLIAASFCQRRGILLVSAGCMVLTILSYALSHGGSPAGAPLARCLASLSAIAITAALVLRNQSAAMLLREQARLLDLTHDSVFVRDMNDVITYWNNAAEAFYGWPRRHAIGRVSHELTQAVFPAPLQAIRDELLRAGHWDGEVVQSKRDGTVVTVESRWSLQRDARGRASAILETNTDITLRKQAEDALRRSEAYLAEAQRLSQTGSFGWNLSSGRIYWSQESHRIFDIPREVEPTIKLIVERTHPDDAGLVQRTIDRALREGDGFDVEHRLLMPDGKVKHVHALASPARDGAGEVELIGALMDVTAARQAQEAMQQAQAELAHVTRLSSLGELTASIAHEVSQPLAAIITGGEASLRWLDRDPPRLGEVRGSVERMIADGRRASEVIRRIRTLSRKADPQKSRLDLNEVVEEAIQLVQHEILRRRVVLRRELAPGLPPVLGDRVQLQQLVINLLINGIQAMESVHERPRLLQVRSRRQAPDELAVAVEDSGIGIEPGQQKQLFNAFFTTKPDGMGMGLSICRSIVEAHGGRIRASCNAGPGATFEFLLPPDQGELS